MAQQIRSRDEFRAGFSGRKVSAWGGLVLFKRMQDRMAFQAAVQGYLPEPHSNRGYAPLLLIEHCHQSIRSGASRFVYTESVSMDAPLGHLLASLCKTEANLGGCI